MVQLVSLSQTKSRRLLILDIMVFQLIYIEIESYLALNKKTWKIYDEK